MSGEETYTRQLAHTTTGSKLSEPILLLLNNNIPVVGNYTYSILYGELCPVRLYNGGEKRTTERRRIGIIPDGEMVGGGRHGKK